MSLLNVQNLTLTLYGASILKQLNFTLEPGEILALTGESGSGKSMTALSLLQLLPDAAELSGNITLDGTNLLRLTEPQLCAQRGGIMGMVFQEPMSALNPVQTIGAQVAEALRLDPKTNAAAAQNRAGAILGRVGLAPEHVPPSRYPHELSGGQRQRVVIALAIARQPKLLIADEPTTALDVTTQAQILALLKRLVREDDMGLIMITHDLAVVADMANRIAVMHRGEIVEQAATSKILKASTHPYTQKLLQAASHMARQPGAEHSRKPLLEVANVQRSYPAKRPWPWIKPPRNIAVKNVSFSLQTGDRMGLVGESGCGKSSLTRAILGLDPVEKGTITLNGKPVWGASSTIRRDLQVVFQDPYGSFNPRHKVAKLIQEAFHLYERPPLREDQEQRTCDVMRAVGLNPDDRGRYIHEFSGGQRQRIAIARALITRPKLVIFDEAVSALDVSVRAQILDLIADLAEQYGLSYLFISHDLSVVRSITDTCMVMKEGEIVEQGSTAFILNTPTHPYTQQLLSAAPKLPKISIGA